MSIREEWSRTRMEYVALHALNMEADQDVIKGWCREAFSPGEELGASISKALADIGHKKPPAMSTRELLKISGLTREYLHALVSVIIEKNRIKQINDLAPYWDWIISSVNAKTEYGRMWLADPAGTLAEFGLWLEPDAAGQLRRVVAPGFSRSHLRVFHSLKQGEKRLEMLDDIKLRRVDQPYTYRGKPDKPVHDNNNPLGNFDFVLQISAEAMYKVVRLLRSENIIAQSVTKEIDIAEFLDLDDPVKQPLSIFTGMPGPVYFLNNVPSLPGGPALYAKVPVSIGIINISDPDDFLRLGLGLVIDITVTMEDNTPRIKVNLRGLLSIELTDTQQVFDITKDSNAVSAFNAAIRGVIPAGNPLLLLPEGTDYWALMQDNLSGILSVNEQFPVNAVNEALGTIIPGTTIASVVSTIHANEFQDSLGQFRDCISIAMSLSGSPAGDINSITAFIPSSGNSLVGIGIHERVLAPGVTNIWNEQMRNEHVGNVILRNLLDFNIVEDNLRFRFRATQVMELDLGKIGSCDECIPDVDATVVALIPASINPDTGGILLGVPEVASTDPDDDDVAGFLAASIGWGLLGGGVMGAVLLPAIGVVGFVIGPVLGAFTALILALEAGLGGETPELPELGSAGMPAIAFQFPVPGSDLTVPLAGSILTLTANELLVGARLEVPQVTLAPLTLFIYRAGYPPFDQVDTLPYIWEDIEVTFDVMIQLGPGGIPATQMFRVRKQKKMYLIHGTAQIINAIGPVSISWFLNDDKIETGTQLNRRIDLDHGEAIVDATLTLTCKDVLRDAEISVTLPPMVGEHRVIKEKISLPANGMLPDSPIDTLTISTGRDADSMAEYLAKRLPQDKRNDEGLPPLPPGGISGEPVNFVIESKGLNVADDRLVRYAQLRPPIRIFSGP